MSLKIALQAPQSDYQMPMKAIKQSRISHSPVARSTKQSGAPCSDWRLVIWNEVCRANA